MFRHLQTSNAHSVIMLRRKVEITTSCMKDQGISMKFKAKYNKKGTLCSIIPLEEKTSTLAVDSKEEEKEEVWVEVEARLFVINSHNQVICQGTVKTLVPIAVTTTHLNMS
jgi:hypothetical protein